MNCPNCGSIQATGRQFCTQCGARLPEFPARRYSSDPMPEPAPIPMPNMAPNLVNNVFLTGSELLSQYRPLSPWAYFGYALLFSIPLIGFICLIIFSFSDENINRRNFARSYWCILLVALIVVAFLAVTGVLAGSAFYRFLIAV